MTIITTTKQMRPRDPDDFYPTPESHIRAALTQLNSLIGYAMIPAILDPGAGNGAWGEVARSMWGGQANITGIELRHTDVPRAYDDWCIDDFRLWRPSLISEFDVVMGNPPYKYAEPFIRLGLEYLAPTGVMVYLLRLAFLEGQERGGDLWRKYPPMLVQVCSERPSFTGDGHTDATAYALYYWRKGWKGQTALGWMRP